MAEIIPKVYDMFRPNPQKLQELAAITICLEIWRYELKKLRTSDTWENFEPYDHAKNISLKTYLPGLPSGIYHILENYVEILGGSLRVWAGNHYFGIFHIFGNHQSFRDLLKSFDDFVCGYGGTIHHDRTAKRMLQCQRFDLNERFSIACVYFFKDDIEEMWPAVAAKNELWLRFSKFSECLPLFYWICRLRKPSMLDKIQNSRNDSVDEIMFCKGLPYRALRPMNYFWNRMPLENRMRKANLFFEYYDKDCFVEQILPRLDDQQLAEIVNEKCNQIMHPLLRIGGFWYDLDEEFILRTWMHIRKFMSERDFSNLVAKMLLTEVISMKAGYGRRERDPDSLVHLCREIWNSAPNNFKRAAIKVILSDSKLFKKRCSIIHDFQLYSNDVEIIFTILYDASFKEKSSFWHNCWHHLILEIRSEDLQRMMKLCFRYECEITQFKEKVIATNAKVHDFCVSLIHRSHFGKLNKFIDFVWSDIQAARNFKQQILQSAFFTGDGYFNHIIVRNPKYFNEFVNDAYNDVDLSNDFKNQLMLSPSVQSCLSDYARSFCCLDEIMEFIDIFVLREETILQIKMRMIDSLKGRLSSDGMSPRDSRLLELSSKFLLWCLGSEEEVTKFKLSMSAVKCKQASTDCTELVERP